MDDERHPHCPTPEHAKKLKKGLRKYRNMVRSKQKARRGLGKRRYR